MDLRKQMETVMRMRQEFPDVPWPNVTREPLFYGKGDRQGEWHDRQVIVITNGESNPVAVCSDEYLLVPHEVAAAELQATALDMYEKWGPAELKVRIIQGGRKMEVWAAFKDAPMTIGRRDAKVEPKIGVRTSYDLAWEFQTSFGGNQLVCTNGMVGFVIESRMKRKHRLGMSIEGHMNMLKQGMEEFDAQKRVWQTWAELNPPAEVFTKFLEDEASKTFGARHMENILALPETGSGETLESWLSGDTVNVFDAYGIFTQYLTHEVESDLVRIDKGREIANRFAKHFTP
jgi:hypothetical protein